MSMPPCGPALTLGGWPHEPGEAARHVAELSERAGFAHTRANVWRYEPGAKGRRHRHVV
ncbi:MAG TPA: hypothetical protein VGJ70_22525 [Solirubrobacteraceae bacterium]